jgi:putative transposase
MIIILSALVSVLSFRFRSRASLELKLVALRHQLIVLRRQRPRRLRLYSADRLLWVCLYRVWPRVLNGLVIAKPATVVKWHRKGSLYSRASAKDSEVPKHRGRNQLS